MAQFKDREEYERWKAERSKQAAQKMTASDSAKEERLPGPSAPGVKRQPPSRPVGLSDISDLFSRAWERYKERFGTLLVLCLLMLLLFLLPLGVFGGSGFALTLVFPDLKAVLIGFFLTLGIILSIVTFFWGMSGLLHAVTDDTLTSREALSRGWTTVGGLIWLLSLLGFLTTGGFLLFFIPGVIFTVWFIFGQFILIEENERGMRALLRSREFVRGYGFDVFLRLFLIWIISGVLAIVPFIGPILSFLFIPFTMIYVYLIYQDLKRIKGDVLIPATRGEKLKWLGTAALGYILLPVLIVALFGASLLPAAPTVPSAFQGLSQAAPDFSVEDDEIRAARVVYKRCAEAYRAGNMSETKRCLSQATLEETEQSGQVDMALGMISGMNIDEFQAHREGNRITFRQSQKQGDATMSMSFTMVKEGNQWKLGN